MTPVAHASDAARRISRRLGGRRVVLAAGGTGGHMFPAHALAEELTLRGWQVVLITDGRGAAYPGLFAGIARHVLDSGRMTGGFYTKLVAIVRILANIWRAGRILKREQPDAVIGFGGYPSLPVLSAAWLSRRPYVLHEQNAVLGRVNRFAARAATLIALAYGDTRRIPASAVGQSRVTGNPVRRRIIELRRSAIPRPRADGVFRLLVIGGSQGAHLLSERVPDALSLLPPALRQRLQVSHQARKEDQSRAIDRYKNAEIAAEVRSFFEDMPERLEFAHLVISRAGASTLAELTAAGRASILVPLGIATDDHQAINAEVIAAAGGAWVFTEADFTAAALAKRVRKAMTEPDSLVAAAAAARALGRPDAASALADAVERVTDGDAVTDEGDLGRGREDPAAGASQRRALA